MLLGGWLTELVLLVGGVSGGNCVAFVDVWLPGGVVMVVVAMGCCGASVGLHSVG